jgi:hypothetical protein
MENMMLAGYRGLVVARLWPCPMVGHLRRNKMRITIHETYEYEVEADSVDEAIELFDQYRDASTREESEASGVRFNQNYLHTYNENMEEI